MAAKTSDWRPGPTVCRCCLSEGCYKDISTEYFWMGKREVYSEMLSETFDLSISYSKSGGPNSQSRLICEPCIARLRDAADFKRQVQECEKTFMSCLDPVTALSDLQAVLELDKEVKVEMVMKEEKRHSDDDFDDAPDFGDDDDYDDLDDQPLTKLASKIPKKEAVDVLDLLDNAKITAKRKSSSKIKSQSSKKSKSKQIATSSKEKPEPKKKKGPENDERRTISIKWKKKPRLEEKANAALILEYSNAVAFRWTRGKFMCAYCSQICADLNEIRAHTKIHDKLEIIEKPAVRNSIPFKVDITNLKCSLCGKNVDNNIDGLKVHLHEKHKIKFNTEASDGVTPFVLTRSEFRCVICDVQVEACWNLFTHMNVHYQSFVCQTCGKGYSAKHKLRTHQRGHEAGEFKCPKCDLVFKNRAVKDRHVSVAHGRKKRYRCPICDMYLYSCHSRLIHLAKVHDQKKEYKCSLCPAIFGTGASRYTHLRVVHKMKKNG
ncbi:zinc finger and BTB domain-containing protein 24-like isoform X21 [Maniola hyperantus]|uniref:zinc finger and BTB domain-containing protein 24-like isoform X21 n=1 Tax=Aphantopus hyperantus TaxID=2795564 RepID=UPI001569186D|nr:zinc finger and BTB domain-containing protein 24-like isoform X10 [Maniola hyperantus]